MCVAREDRAMPKQETVTYDRIKGVKQIPLEEFYTSGHRTCQGCESAMVMRDFRRFLQKNILSQDVEAG